MEGNGISKDVPKGLRQLRAAGRAGEAALSLEAAKAGVPAAQYDVCVCLLTVTGVKKDSAAVERWIARAAKGGDRHAQECLLRRTQRRRARRRSQSTS